MKMNRERFYNLIPELAAGLYILVLAMKPVAYYLKVEWTPYMFSGVIESLIPCFFCILLALMARKSRLFGGALFILTGLFEILESFLGNTPALLFESLPYLFIGLLFIVTRSYETSPQDQH